MIRTGLMITGFVALLGGIALAVYGYSLAPNAGEALGNLFTGDFTDRRNTLVLGGLVAAVAGASFMGAAYYDARKRARMG